MTIVILESECQYNLEDDEAALLKEKGYIFTVEGQRKTRTSGPLIGTYLAIPSKAFVESVERTGGEVVFWRLSKTYIIPDAKKYRKKDIPFQNE